MLQQVLDIVTSGSYALNIFVNAVLVFLLLFRNILTVLHFRVFNQLFLCSIIIIIIIIIIILHSDDAGLPLACWDCGFKSHPGQDICLL